MIATVFNTVLILIHYRFKYIKLIKDSNTKDLLEPIETKFYSVQDSEPGNKSLYDLSISLITGMLQYFPQYSIHYYILSLTIPCALTANLGSLWAKLAFLAGVFTLTGDAISRYVDSA